MIMRGIGFRVEPKAIHWGIVEGTKDSPLVIADDVISAPKTYDEASTLSLYRSQISLVLNQYYPKAAAIRYSEPNARGKLTNSTRLRVQIEGIILQLLHSEGLNTIAGASNTLTANIGSDSLKKYISSDEFRGIDWASRSDKRREAILAAVSTLRD